MPPGLNFGSDLQLPRFKVVKKPRKKVTSRAKAEKTRKNQREDREAERQRRRKEKLSRRAARREEKKLSRAERGEPEVMKAKKSTRKSSHGTEEVDAIILKVLGRSRKTKKVGPKLKAEKVGVAGPKWRHGMREERHESRTVEKKGSKKPRTSKMSPSPDQAKTFVEKQPKADICQVLPIVDVGPDYEADGGHFGHGGGAAALARPVRPDCAAPSGGEEAAELASPQPAQNLLDPEAFCLKFYQVRRKLFCIIQNMVGACFIVTNTLKTQSYMNLPLFRCPWTTSALPKAPTLLLPSHPARQQHSLLTRGLLLTSLPTWQPPRWREAPGSKYLT